MRMKAIATALALVMATAAPPAFAQEQKTQFLGTQLSSCMRNALIGAGVGAAVGVLTAPKGNKTENLILGAALGGGGTFLVCKYLKNRDQTRIERSYMSALTRDRAVTSSFTTQESGPATLSVPKPVADAGNPNCRTLSPSLAVGGMAAQALPQERYCKINGVWTPQAG